MNKRYLSYISDVKVWVNNFAVVKSCHLSGNCVFCICTGFEFPPIVKLHLSWNCKHCICTSLVFASPGCKGQGQLRSPLTIEHNRRKYCARYKVKYCPVAQLKSNKYYQTSERPGKQNQNGLHDHDDERGPRDSLGEQLAHHILHNLW